MKTHNDRQFSHSAIVQSSENTVRWVFESPSQAIPELKMLGCDNPRSALPLTEHRHPNAFEFVFIERGQATWEIDGERFTTRSGDIFHTCPEERHRGSYDVIDPCRFWWLILEVPMSQNARWLQLSSPDSRALLDQLWQLPRVVTTGMLQTAGQFKRLKQALQRSDALSELEARLAILDLLTLMLRPEPNPAFPDDMQQSLNRMIEKMADHPEWRPSVPELADLAGVSPSHFYRIFQKYTGLAPMAYMERLRIETAGRRLKETADAVTEIALDLGYASSQHFATVFRRVTGRTPTEWRKG